MQAGTNLLLGAGAAALEDNFRADAKEENEEKPEPRLVLPSKAMAQGGLPEFSYSPTGDGGKDTFGENKEENPGPGNLGGTGDEEEGSPSDPSIAAFGGNKEDADSPSAKSPGGSPSTLGLDNSPKDLLDNDKASIGKMSYRGGGPGSRFAKGGGTKYGNDDAKGGSSGFKFKVAKNERDSHQQLRKLSSTSNKHKSIFEHMSSLINSYCNKGQQNCR